MEQYLGPLGIWILIFGVFWFLFIRPQQKRQKDHQAMLKSLEAGDDVITIGGIRGKILKVKDDYFVLKVSPEVKIEVIPTAIARRHVQNDEA